jgi:adenine-specific DNA-methyltransferase
MNFWKLHYERKQDIYYYFFIRGIEALKESGKLGFITPPYWLTANATGKLKQYIKDNSRLLKVYDFGSEKIFDDAQIDGNIFIFTKEKSINEPICICEYDKDKKTFEQYISKFSNDDLTIGMWNIFTNDKEEDVFDKLSNTELGKIATISPGIQTGSDYVSKSHIEKLNLTNVQVNEGIFVISEQEKQSKFEEKDSCYIKPFYKNSQIG